MKICFLSSLYYESKLGEGVYNYLHTVPKALQKKGHAITIVTAGSYGVQIDHGFTVVTLQKLKVYTSIGLLLSPFYVVQRISYVIKAAAYIRNNDFDIVESADGGFEHLLLVLFKRCPVVTRMHGRMTLRTHLPFAAFFTGIENFAIKKSDGVVFPSYSFKKYSLIQYMNIFPNSTVIPYMIPIHKEIKKKHTSKKVILVVGMLTERKGIKLLIQIAQKFLYNKSISFILIGANVEGVNLQTLPSNVYYLGQKTHSELKAYYRNCLLFLSTSKFETFGIAIAEAMSFGKPVVINDSIGPTDFVKNGRNGFIFKKDDYQDAVDKIKILLRNSRLQSTFGKKGKDDIRKYSEGNILRSTISYYEKITKKR